MGHSDLSKVVSKFSVSMHFFFPIGRKKGFIFKGSMTKWLKSTTLLVKLINVRTEEPGRLQSMGSRRVGDDSDFPFTFHFQALEKEMATHSSVLAWRTPGMGEPGGLPSMGSHRVGHDWSDLAAAAAAAVTWYYFCDAYSIRPYNYSTFPSLPEGSVNIFGVHRKVQYLCNSH